MQNEYVARIRKVDLQPCVPPLWARTGHGQTILGHLLRSPTLDLGGEKIVLSLAGGDQGIARLYTPDANESRTIVYLFHGLGGTSQGSYMQRSALVALSLGHKVIMFNHRGCGEGEGLAREPYHSGRAEDLSAVIAYGRDRFQDHRHISIGFSLSGNASLLMAAGIRAETKPDAAIAVNAPIDLSNASRLLKAGLNRVYDLNFMFELRNSIRTRQRAGFSIEDVRLAWNSTIHDFDDLYTAPAGGFKNREDYYKTCSARQYLKDISIPTVILTAEDDPFVSFSDYRTAEISSLAHLHAEKFGGHMGYLTRNPTPLGTKRWLDYALHEYLVALA